jgi:hypothetical protein
MQETQNIYEKRLTERMRVYWENISDNQDIPLYSRFNPNSLGEIWDSCLGIKVTNSNGKNIYQFSHEGIKIKQTLEKDLKFKYINPSDNSGIINKSFINSLDECLDQRKIIMSSGQFVTDKGRIVKYRDCILPFKKMDGKIDTLIVGISWKVF